MATNGRGDDPGHHQPVDRVDAEHLHRVDLLADGAGAEVGADGRRAGAGDHQHRDQRAELGDRADRRARAGEVGGAELGQQDVEREDEQHGQRDRHHDGGQERHPHEEPALQDELAPLERPAEQRLAGQHAHPEEAADERQRASDLVADVADQSPRVDAVTAPPPRAPRATASRQIVSHAPLPPAPAPALCV